MLDFRYFNVLLTDLQYLIQTSPVSFQIHEICIDEFLKEVVFTFRYDKLYSIQVLELVYELGNRVNDSMIFTYDPRVEIYGDSIKAHFPFENIELVYNHVHS